ncbi:MAG TPA: helicase C-terminal domain-containing protein [Rectinemataceae bacterium]|nr:helicase C-terminal domain-containing protein [Rectinemataceae bacterium]
MDALERFTTEAAEAFAAEVEGAEGNEVFAAGRLDAEGRVAEIIVAARGHGSAVPALEGFADRGDVVIHNHPSGRLSPSDPDLAVASDFASRGLGFYIVDSGCTQVYVVAEPVRKRSLVHLDAEEISGVLDAGGKLGRMIESFEPRPSQVRLVKDIVDSFNAGEVLAAEAGTGVGKSFAYLVPSFAWAIRNEERVVISTATINLQRQLVDKDIPIVQRLFKKKTKAVLVKGRGNYLCRTRLREALDEEGLLAGDEHPLKRIAAWAEASASGDRADLSFWPEESTWSRVASDSDSCTGLRCPDREACFVLKMKREAADAQVIVANHHILFSDLSARMEGAGYEGTVVLPPFQVLVIDEAHSVENSATDFFSRELNRFGLQRRLSRLQRGSRGQSFGLVPRLKQLQGFPAEALDRLPTAIAEARAAINELDAKALALFPGRERHFRLTERSALLHEALLEPLLGLERGFLAAAEIVRDALDEAPEELSQERVVFETRLALRRLSETAATAAAFKDFEDNRDKVYWVEKGRSSQGEAFITCVESPLDITGIMEEAVFSKFRSVVCTSATLSVGDSFDFWKGRVGLRDALPARDADPEDPAEAGIIRFRSSVYPSPFPYRTNALLCVDAEAPLPDHPDWKAYVNRAIVELLRASEGRALVLFTSYETLKAAYDIAKPQMDAMGIVCMRQGEDERSRLLDTFKTDISSVLFATDSFWEGVDAPGETLSLVIITKLPFRVPTDPVQLARSEACERRGGNAFMEISLPEAVIRLKQGFGRLIRHSEDRGAVVILDSRIVKKRYGGLFINSLPECRLQTSALAEIVPLVRKFLFDW